MADKHTIRADVVSRDRDEVFEYLDDLRDSGATNMFGARPYVLREFPALTEAEAGHLVVEWMRTFSARRAAERSEATS